MASPIPPQLSTGVGSQASTAQRAPSPALPLTALPPGLAIGPAAPHPQSAAAALQQAGLAAPAQPGQQPWQQPPDQGTALLAHLQSQARSNMGQMCPQDPSGVQTDLLRCTSQDHWSRCTTSSPESQRSAPVYDHVL